MAKGDVVNGYLTGASTFQPAAGVEIVVTTLTETEASVAVQWMLYNGTDQGEITATGGLYNAKICITNSMYLQKASATGGAMYSGVQVK